MAKTIIVTGASRGIGLAIARYLVREGHNVVVCARSKDPLEEFQAENQKQIRVLTGDMTAPGIGKSVTDLALKEFGQLDGLVLNHAMLAPVSRLVDAQVDEWMQNFNVNVFSAVAFLQAAIPALRKTKAKVILTSSGAAIHSYSSWGAYCASKAAFKSLGETLALEEKEITTISIAPGVVDTDMQRELREVHIKLMDEKDQQLFTGLKEEGKLLKPEQPGDVMARLVLDAPSEFSGKMFRWDNSELAAFHDS